MKNSAFKVECPACRRKVDAVDGEYARHTANGNLCPMSKRDTVKVRGKKGKWGRS